MLFEIKIAVQFCIWFKLGMRDREKWRGCLYVYDVVKIFFLTFVYYCIFWPWFSLFQRNANIDSGWPRCWCQNMVETVVFVLEKTHFDSFTWLIQVLITFSYQLSNCTIEQHIKYNFIDGHILQLEIQIHQVLFS